MHFWKLCRGGRREEELEEHDENFLSNSRNTPENIPFISLSFLLFLRYAKSRASDLVRRIGREKILVQDFNYYGSWLVGGPPLLLPPPSPPPKKGIPTCFSPSVTAVCLLWWCRCRWRRPGNPAVLPSPTSGNPSADAGKTERRKEMKTKRNPKLLGAILRLLLFFLLSPSLRLPPPRRHPILSDGERGGREGGKSHHSLSRISYSFVCFGGDASEKNWVSFLFLSQLFCFSLSLSSRASPQGGRERKVSRASN